MRWRMRTAHCIAVVAVVAALTAGCGGSESNGAKETEGSEEAPEYLKGLSGVVYFNQSGGELETGYNKAFVDDFERLSGVKVMFSSPCCDYARLKAMHESGNMKYDMLEIGGPGDMPNLIDEGLLQKFSYEGVDKSQFEKSALTPYGYMASSSGSIVIWNTEKWPLSGVHPTSVLDIFDTERFPGKRCLYGAGPSLNGVLEYASIAAGTPMDQVYPIDIEKALSKLDEIRDDIIWWESGAESIQFILDGQCDIGTTWHGRPALRLSEDPNLPIDGTYNGAMIGGGLFAVPTGAPNRENAMALMRFYLQKDVQVAMCNAIAYCMSMKGVEEQIDPAMRKWAAVGPNLKNTFPEGGDYWAANIDKVAKRWNTWLATGR
jgi:putative spermidine/putrescine transport system substrate-binding protein